MAFSFLSGVSQWWSTPVNKSKKEGVSWQGEIENTSIKKWCCPECGMNVRMGYAGDPILQHHTREETTGSPVF